MSSEKIEVSPEAAKKNQQFITDRKRKGTQRYIKRHSLQARLTHGITVVCCIWLCISGLFVFVPPLTQMAGQDIVFVMRMSHRVIGVVFVAVPIISAIKSPRGVKHIFSELFAKWNEDDKKWMILFLPYLFMAKWIHMPDQDETKSGQRFADGMLWLSGALMGITGVSMLLGSTIFTMPGEVYAVFLFFHDLGFLLIAVFAMAHIFLGSGLFQPYRRTAKLMWGDGYVSESDALYHWGHWARKEIEKGDNVIEK